MSLRAVPGRQAARQLIVGLLEALDVVAIGDDAEQAGGG
jgi:hypothetical protein